MKSFETLENRKKSYFENGWDESYPVSVDELSEAGFYYMGREDYVDCFQCSICLGDWIEGNDPWIGHARYSPDCEFLKLNKSQEFINKYQD